MARFDLSAADVSVRLTAVKEILRDIDEPAAELLRQRVSLETDPAVKIEIETGLAVAALGGSDTPARLQAIETLSSRISSDVRNRLAALNEKSEAGEFVEPDPTVRQAAKAAVERIDDSRAIYSAIETMFFGLSMGSVLVLVAIGLAITFGVMGVINMAHGELMMLGAYTTYVVQTAMPDHVGASILVAIPGGVPRGRASPAS